MRDKYKVLIVFLFILSFISLVDASSFGYDNPKLPKVTTPAQTGTTYTNTTNNYNTYNNITQINNFTTNATVNNTQFSSNNPITILESWLRGVITGYNYITITNVAYTNQSNVFTQNQTIPNVCYSNGTNCQASSGGSMNYTNIAMTNQSNSFGNFNQSFNSSTLFINANSRFVGVGTTTPKTIFDAETYLGSSPAATTGQVPSNGTIARFGNAAGNVVMDVGNDGGNGAWLQVTNAANLGLKYSLDLNPNGGGLTVGKVNSTSGTLFTLGANAAFSGVRLALLGYASDITKYANLEIGDGGTIYMRFMRDINNNFLITTGSGGDGSLSFLTKGNIGIKKQSPGYPLDVNGSTSGITIYASNNISATGYITRTDVFDKSQGSALDMIKDSSFYLNKDGSINHSAFGSSAVAYDKKVVDKVEDIIVKDNGVEMTVQNITYKTIKEEGVSLDKEVSLLKQAVYELKVQNGYLQQEINNLTGENINLGKVNDVQNEAICSIKIFDWCLK